MRKYTVMELEKGRMLAQKVSTFRKAQVTPLSRASTATTLVIAAIRLAVWQRMRLLSRWLRDKQVCPACEGATQLRDNYVRICMLCHGQGEVTWREVESKRWGAALNRYIEQNKLDPSYFWPRLTHNDIYWHVNGWMTLDDWDEELAEMADLQLDREAAGHVSTT